MSIVYTDAHTLNPGDLDWAPIQSLGDVTFYGRITPDQLLERLKKVDAVLTNKVKLNRETITQLPRLRYIGVTATGYDIIDLQAFLAGTPKNKVV